MITTDRGPLTVALVHAGAAVAAALRGAGHTVLEPDPSAYEDTAADVLVIGNPHPGQPMPHGEDLLALTSLPYRWIAGSEVRHVVSLGSTSVMDGYADGWYWDEDWAPRPTSAALPDWFFETVTREVLRAAPGLTGVALRADRGWVQPTDEMVAAVLEAVQPPTALRVMTIDDALWRPRHVLTDPLPSSAGEPAWPTVAPVRQVSRPRRITLYGAGPLGVATAEAIMAAGIELVWVDLRSLEEIAAAPPQAPGAPVPGPIEAPHRAAICDVTDADQVLEAARGSDCLINVTVLRHQLDGGMRVNLQGGMNVVDAAIELGLQRIVHTGPTRLISGFPWGYSEATGVGDASPSRPGADPYSLSKHLAAEYVRTLAAEHGLMAPILEFCQLVHPDFVGVQPSRHQQAINPYTISWRDAGEAVLAAALVSDLPEPAPVIQILAPHPAGRYLGDSAERLLGWRPQDRFLPVV
ncbi:NAD-dependent epimerase/dehydratase family protein [Parenemella sanctibonifatiensis]|uniref:NAD-dependent epimerase/dehydratase domain-containing protein n=1 Tax=Parenemella sanctibonifatiensis TaxID=2016505 RepID=A0A255ELF9_9ACTN|nr:NAD-dependent epimerase/dehydratase family protein [Parenemella sanctibonifatiensis]OYN90445.1 hypothetical protein CGZ92_01005 [Parenemella sanctibonifatiensis]